MTDHRTPASASGVFCIHDYFDPNCAGFHDRPVNLAGCSRREPPPRALAIKPTVVEAFDRYESVPIGAAVEGEPWISHVAIVDLDRDGDLDLLVACMGEVFPDNDKIGSVVALENDGAQRFTPHVLLHQVARVTDVRAGDLLAHAPIQLIACVAADLTARAGRRS